MRLQSLKLLNVYKSENNKLSSLYVKCLKCIFYVLQFSYLSLLCEKNNIKKLIQLRRRRDGILDAVIITIYGKKIYNELFIEEHISFTI